MPPTADTRRPAAHLPAAVAAAALAALAALAPPPAAAQARPAAPAAAAAPAPSRSALDGVLFYQILVSELEMRRGEAGIAYQVMLDAARRSGDEALFRRAVDIAIEARAGDRAVEALKAWRQALPASRQAVEIEVQMLMALGRAADAREPLRTFIALTPVIGRAEAIASLPRLVAGGPKPEAAAKVIDEVLAPWRAQADTRLAARTATAASWLAGGDRERALAAAREAQQVDAGHPGAAFIALELLRDLPAAEPLVQAHLEAAPASSLVRAAYVRRLSTAQRYRDALVQAEQLTAQDPQQPAAWLMLGALQLELGQPAAARTSLERHVALQQARPADPPAAGRDDEGDGEAEAAPAARGAAQDLQQAHLMLAQASEQLHDYAAASAWLDRVGDPADAAAIQRRASLLMRQGRLAEARAMLARLPGDTPQAQRGRLMAEVQLLRDARQWQPAHDLLADAVRRTPDDPDLLYEQALLAERLMRHDDMERLLRRVMVLRPDQQHAYNALGYSLADRNVRLAEARQLVERALAIAPGDPFITDSLGWVEFRAGRHDEAARLLAEAYRQRPDVEIAAHYGEVLWAMGRRDEARRIWRQGLETDRQNEVLGETLRRLGVQP
ncbi:MAG: hypothetical protein RL456_2634 [Pseudomonadota bacterium]